MNKEELVENVRQLRSRLQLAISEYDDAELKEATGLRIEYTEKVGQFECAQFELYLQYEEINRKIEMVQARINRGEKIDMDAINFEVANILEKYYTKLNGMRDNVEEMLGYRFGAFVKIDNRAEIKSIYRKLMKILHPDVAGPKMDFDPELWKRVQTAYKENDLETLRMINDIVGEATGENLESMEETELLDMQERMELAIKRYQIKLQDLKRRFPFTEAEHLKNDAWVRARQAELKKSIEEYKQAVVFLAASLETIIREER
ncbi:MAG: hypothetical protein MJ092_05085 [Lachnospiraceae bacterium]|nr:hypothetical protein [Lachnospiraceae bacterium]